MGGGRGHADASAKPVHRAATAYSRRKPARTAPSALFGAAEFSPGCQRAIEERQQTVPVAL